MKSLLLIIVLFIALSCAWRILPSAEQAIEKEAQLAEEERSNTLNEMKRRRRRCAVLGMSKNPLLEDYARWESSNVTYRISNYTQKLPRADVDEIIKKAFELWSNHTCLTFIQSWNESDIEILFGAGVHTEIDIDCPFDEDNELGHALFSRTHGERGYIHFNEDQNWTKDFSGINLNWTAVHEIGHILGSDHTTNKEAVMYASYEGSVTFRLHQDDIEAIQALHGKPGNCSDPPRYPAPPTEIPPETFSLCEGLKTFDAVAAFRGNLLFFYAHLLIQYDPVTEKYNISKIEYFWPILKCGVEAAYEAEGTLYLFSGWMYRTVSGDFTNLSSSQYIYTLGLPKRVSNIDAAVYDQETKTMLFFKGSYYWRIDEETESVEEGYPRMIRDDFPAINFIVTAAFQYNGSLYLHSGLKLYEFDPRTYRLINIEEINTWFGCEE